MPELSAAAQVPVTAAGVWAARADIPEAARQAHELLELALRFGRTGRWHTFADLALEYQLTRPGNSRERLAALLDPLDDHPQLEQTLRLHLCSDLSRRRVAQLLNIHANALDYRLKRVGRLTGMDPLSPDGQWYLRAALVARTAISNSAAAQQLPAIDQSERTMTPRSVVSRR